MSGSYQGPPVGPPPSSNYPPPPMSSNGYTYSAPSTGPPPSGAYGGPPGAPPTGYSGAPVAPVAPPSSSYSATPAAPPSSSYGGPPAAPTSAAYGGPPAAPAPSSSYGPPVTPTNAAYGVPLSRPPSYGGLPAGGYAAPPSSSGSIVPPPVVGPTVGSTMGGAPPAYAPPTGAPPMGAPPTSGPPMLARPLPTVPEYAPPPTGPPVSGAEPPPPPPNQGGRMGTAMNGMRPPALDTSLVDNPHSFSSSQLPIRKSPSTATASINARRSPSNQNLSLQPPDAQGMRRNASSSEFSSGSGTKKTSRIDPGQMPRPDKGHHDTVYHTRSGSGRRNPPICNSIYRAVDTGNCIPRHLRVSMVAAPANAELLKNTALPFAVLSTPLAFPENGEDPVPMVNMADFEASQGETPSPPRCTRCRGYINPNVVFTKGGNNWNCNLCGMVNDVPGWYYYNVDGNGLRNDRLKRPELQLGSVEFVVSKDYCVRPVQEPIYVFAVDISDRAVANGSTMASLRALKAALARLGEIDAVNRERHQRQPTMKGFISPPARQSSGLASMFMSNKTAPAPMTTSPSAATAAAAEAEPYKEIRMGIVTFNSGVHFYSVNNREHSPDPVRIWVVDAADPFAPLPNSEWLFNVTSQRAYLDKLLSRLPDLVVSLQDTKVDAAGYQKTQYTGIEEENQSCPTAAIKSVQCCLEKVGGRIFVLTSSHSTVGYGKIARIRENINHYQNPTNEIALYGSPAAIASVYNRASTSFTIPLPGGTHAKPTVQQSYNDELRATCDLYSTLAQDCARMVCPVFLYALIGESLNHAAYFDGALMSEPSIRTGGRYQLMPGNMAQEENAARVSSQLVGDIDGLLGSEAVVKLRSSVGIKVDEYTGQGIQSELGGDEVSFASLDRGTSVMFTLKYDQSLKDEDKVHLQLATLYTNSLRQRVVRVHNITLVCSNKMSVIYRNSDIETVMVALTKQAVNSALTVPLVDDTRGARATSSLKLTEVLYNYRKFCSANSPRGQLILPESLKVLPIYTLGLLKHASLVENKIGGSGVGAGATPRTENSTPRLLTGGGAESGGLNGLIRMVAVRGFERSYEIRKLLNVPVGDVINALYPRMYSLLPLMDVNDTASVSSIGLSSARSSDSNDHYEPSSIDKMRALLSGGAVPQPSAGNPLGGAICMSDREALKLQKVIYPSSELFEADQIYLLDDRSSIWIYVGRNVSQNIIPDIFNVSPDNPYERPDSVGFNVSSELGAKVQAFVDMLTSSSAYKQDIRVIWSEQRSDNPMITKFSSRLVEDSLFGNSSYVDFLCNVHAKIQAKLK